MTKKQEHRPDEGTTPIPGSKKNGAGFTLSSRDITSEDPKQTLSHNGKPICGATRTNGSVCQSFPMANGRCKNHGGMSPKGVAAGRYKHGRYSKFLPTNLRAKYEELIADDNLLDLSDEIATQSALIMEQMETLSAAPEVPYTAVLRQLSELQKASAEFLDSGDDTSFQRAFVGLAETIERGRDAEQVRAKAAGHIRNLIQEKTKTASAEWKRLTDLQGVLTADRALLLVDSVLRAVRDVVSDRKQLQAVQARVIQLLPERSLVSSKVAEAVAANPMTPTPPPPPAAAEGQVISLPENPDGVGG